MSDTAAPPPASARPFPEHFRESVQVLRAALIELLAAVGADPSQPQELARRFGLNKNLTWKVSKIVAAADEFAAAPHVPGSGGVDILLKALAKAGAPEAQRRRVREAMDAYDRMVALHSGDRATLELLTAGLSRDPGRADRLEQSRRLAYMGCGGTWGVQADVQLATRILSPSDSVAGTTDYLTLGGLYGFRRLRPDVSWTLFRNYATHDDGSGMLPEAPQAIDPASARDGLDLIGEHCSPELPGIEVVRTDREMRYVLPEGPVGNTAAFHCVHGSLFRAFVPAHRTETDRAAEIAVTVVTPVERVQLDLMVHDEMEWFRDPQHALFSRLDGSDITREADRERQRLPVLEDVQHLGRGIANMASAHVPRYTDLLRTAFEAAGWDGEAFHGFRFEMRYPPIPTTMVLMADLPEA